MCETSRTLLASVKNWQFGFRLANCTLTVMRSTALQVLLALLTPISNFAQTSDSSPATQRRTVRDTWIAYEVAAFGPRGLCEPVFPATYWMASPPDHDPRGWRKGAGGFTRNYGAELVSQNRFPNRGGKCGRSASRRPSISSGRGSESSCHFLFGLHGNFYFAR